MKRSRVVASGIAIIALLLLFVFRPPQKEELAEASQDHMEPVSTESNFVQNAQGESRRSSGAETTGSNPLARKVYKPKTENKRHPNLITYEIEHGLPSETPAGKERRQIAQISGASGKVTLCVVDANGDPVSNAKVDSWFWTGGESNRIVNGFTDSRGMIGLEENSMSYMGFTVNKEGYYQTRWKYWFYERGYDCVEDGRWLPWNPVLEVVLKEVRLPLQLPQKKAEISFPANTRVGFDFIVGDLVEPYGKGKTNDAVFHVSGVAINGKEFHYTNTLSFVDGSGIVSHAPDSFSILKSDYVAPENGYTLGTTFRYDYDGTHAGSDDTSQRDRILYFKVRGNREQGARYGKIVGGVVGGLAYPDTDTAGLVFSYFLNPNDGDRNLEYEDAYEFKPFLGKSE